MLGLLSGRFPLLCLTALIIADPSGAFAQSSAAHRPRVIFEPASIDYLQALNGDQYYTNEDARADYSWVTRRGRAVDSLWSQYGDSALSALTTLSGVDWREGEIRIRLVRYLSGWYLSDPATVALAGRRQGSVYDAGPFGEERLLQIVELLADRLITAKMSADTTFAGHPLVAPSQFHRGALLTHLTLAVGSTLFKPADLDSLRATPGFGLRHPSLGAVIPTLRSWRLSEATPLVSFVLAEPRTSAIVHAADSALAQMETQVATALVVSQSYFAGTQSKFGLGLESHAAGLRVVTLDTAKLASVYGVSVGDIITSVNGSRAEDIRSFYRLLLTAYNTNGATLTVNRAGQPKTIALRRGAKKQR